MENDRQEHEPRSARPSGL